MKGTRLGRRAREGTEKSLLASNNFNCCSYSAAAEIEGEKEDERADKEALAAAVASAVASAWAMAAAA
jgi:hypothetical protein